MYNRVSIRMSLDVWTAPEYLKAKPKIRLLLLGSYEVSAEADLQRVKDFLIAKGYSQTHLVADFTNPPRNEREENPDYNLRKSESWLPRADIAIFVFLKNVNNDGVGYELTHVIDNYPDMMWRSIIGWSTNPRPNVSSLIEGLVNRWKKSTNVVFFGTLDKLCEEILGVLTGMLERLYYRVKSRTEGEWELDLQI
jgi:hypothetical protein